MRKGQQNDSHLLMKFQVGIGQQEMIIQILILNAKKFSIILSRHPVTFTLINLEMKGQTWRKYLCLLGTPLNYHKTLDVY